MLPTLYHIWYMFPINSVYNNDYNTVNYTVTTSSHYSRNTDIKSLLCEDKTVLYDNYIMIENTAKLHE